MRTYNDRCGIARALDVVGDRWALLVVRDLLLGPKRFSDLRAGLRRVTADVLSQRLRELEAAGVLQRRRLPPPASAQVYELTARGRELEPVILGLGRWGSRTPVPDGDPPLSPDSAMLALKTLFDPAAARDVTVSYELRFGEQQFHARVENGALTIGRGPAEHADATIETEPETLAAVLWHGARTGDANLVRLRTLFPLR
jgi:DNA-binding HxlR family transcriptional regulator